MSFLVRYSNRDYSDDVLGMRVDSGVDDQRKSCGDSDKNGEDKFADNCPAACTYPDLVTRQHCDQGSQDIKFAKLLEATDNTMDHHINTRGKSPPTMTTKCLILSHFLGYSNTLYDYQQPSKQRYYISHSKYGHKSNKWHKLIFDKNQILQ